MGERHNLLGEYLRARRAQVGPAEAGFAEGGNRRIAGLRREEVALLAGISTHYYLRLEQGRDRNPTPAVLDSLAYALKLDETAAAHLRTLAAPRITATRPLSDRYQVKPSIQNLIASLGQPAMVVDRHFDIVSSNRLAVAFSSSFRVGENRLLSTFFDSSEVSQYADWDAASSRLVAALRGSVGNLAADARTSELVTALSRRSKRFRSLWSGHGVAPTIGDITVPIRHSLLGAMNVTHERLPIGGTDGQILVITSAEPGTESAEKLCRLVQLAERI